MSGSSSTAAQPLGRIVYKSPKARNVELAGFATLSAERSVAPAAGASSAPSPRRPTRSLGRAVQLLVEALPSVSSYYTPLDAAAGDDGNMTEEGEEEEEGEAGEAVEVEGERKGRGRGRDAKSPPPRLPSAAVAAAAAVGACGVAGATGALLTMLATTTPGA